MKPSLQNQQARDRLASLMRAMYTNRITNLEFDEHAEEIACDDDAAFQVFFNGAWRTYDDFKEQRFTGEKALNGEGKREVARWILFLKSGQPYDWPGRVGLPRWTFWIALLTPVGLGLFFGRWDACALSLILAILLFGFLDIHYARRKQPSLENAGDVEVWPFISKARYEEALKNPPYLCCADRRS